MRREAASSDLSALLEHAFTGGIVIDPWRRGEVITLRAPRLHVWVATLEAQGAGHVRWDDPASERRRIA